MNILSTARLLIKESLFARLGLIAVVTVLVLVNSLLYYLTYQRVEADNKAKLTTAQLTSHALLDKLDRNFYERFGDVQAFAHNRLAVNALKQDSVSADLQDFMNTMTSYYVLYDLMMIVDLDGKVVAVNTKDKKGYKINSDALIRSNKNFLHEEWFKACVSEAGPDGGAWYSDFMANPDVASIHNSNGYGMAFAAPVRDESGKVLGVWYNFASWKEITQTIRGEVEAELQKDDPEATILLTKATHEIIDATNAELVTNAANIDEKYTASSEETLTNPLKTYDDYISGWASATGAYTYKGKGWRAVTLLNRSQLTVGQLFSRDMLPVFLSIGLILLGLGWLTFGFFKTRIIRRINQTRAILEQLSKGQLATVPDDLKSTDEIGKMAHSLASLVQSIESKVLFSNEIAKGNLSVQLDDISKSDVLGTSLANMRDQLSLAAQEDRRRNWIAEGVAKTADIIRTTIDLHLLSEQVLSHLVHYLNANQGAIFVKSGEGEETVLTLTACYAFNRKKHAQKTVKPGEGMLGQVFLEGEHLYMTHIPDNHVTITSGLGESNPRCLLMIPLKYDGKTEGVIEIASYQTLESFEVDFALRVCENLAAAIMMAKNNHKTLQLLKVSQEQSEELRAQEEMMRQNVEELATTQEEMMRKETESSALVAVVNQALATIEFSPDGIVQQANDNFLKLMGYKMEEIQGTHHRIFVLSEDSTSPDYQLFWEQLRGGLIQSREFRRITKAGEVVWIRASYMPMYDANGKVIRIMKLAQDITEQMLLKHQAEQQAEELRAQEEELRQNMEELVSIQESLERKERDYQETIARLEANS